MTNEEKMIIKKYFEKCGAQASESCLDMIEKEDLTNEFLNYAKNGKNFLLACCIRLQHTADSDNNKQQNEKAPCLTAKCFFVAKKPIFQVC